VRGFAISKDDAHKGLDYTDWLVCCERRYNI